MKFPPLPALILVPALISAVEEDADPRRRAWGCSVTDARCAGVRCCHCKNRGFFYMAGHLGLEAALHWRRAIRSSAAREISRSVRSRLAQLL